MQSNKKEKKGNPIVSFFDKLTDGCVVFGCLAQVILLVMVSFILILI